MFVDELRRAIQAAPRMRFPAVSQALWAAVAAGEITETDAEDLDSLLRARMTVVPPPKPAPRQVGSRPRSAASLERRRRWAASGRLPPQLAARFTMGETAALAVVATEVAHRGDCRLALEHVAALAGVCRSTVKTAVREARRLGLLTLEERRQAGRRSDTNVIRIVSPAWGAWIRLGRRSRGERSGVNFVTTSNTNHKKRPSLGRVEEVERGFRRGGGGGSG